MNNFKCLICGCDMKWVAESSYEDCGYEDEKGDGIVSMYTCSNCDASAEFYNKKFE